LSVYNLGTSLTRMGQRSDIVRLLDDIDLTLSLDSRTTASHQMMNIEVNCKPIILRASYRDILLILGITNKVLEAYGSQNQHYTGLDSSSTTSLTSHGQISQRPGPPSTNRVMRRMSSRGTQGSSKPLGKAKVLMSKESCRATVDGLKLVLIGDIQEQPLLHVQFKAFRIDAKDWSGQVCSNDTICCSLHPYKPT
jgi:vacuolar protein sorting-associated protein 13A/C